MAVAVDAPEFYCHGQACIYDGCSPLRCKDTPMDDQHAPWCPQNGTDCLGCEACG
jgi:hypothetical protein